MCIIVVKPRNTKLPKEQILKNCFENNPDGAGFMYIDNDGFIQIKKGFMTFDSLKKELNSLHQEINIKERAIILHFRQKTHGEISPHNTHPFPITRNLNDLKALNIKCTMALAHNGIIPNITRTIEEISDTMAFIKNISHKDMEIIRAKLSSTLNNKFVFLDSQYYWVYGYFIKDDNGIQYSNDGYKKYIYYDNLYGNTFWKHNTTYPLNHYEKRDYCAICGYVTYMPRYDILPDGSPICNICYTKNKKYIDIDPYILGW